MGINKDQKALRKNAVGMARNRANEEPADSEETPETETIEITGDPDVQATAGLVVAEDVEITEEPTDG